MTMLMRYLAVLTIFLPTSSVFSQTAYQKLDDHQQSELKDREGPILVSDETRLHNHLFHKKRYSHPTNEVLEVLFGLTLLSVVDYDAVGEEVVINAYIRQEWMNPALSWDPKRYGGIKRINVSPDKTWTPDNHAYSNLETGHFKYNGMLDTMKTHIVVHHNGENSWMAPIVMHLNCGMNVADFPFDLQNCPLHFCSVTYDSNKLNLFSDDVDMGKYSESSEWKFNSMNHTTEILLNSATNTNFSHVTYTLKIKRKPLYYFRQAFLPTIIFSFLLLLVFIQPIGASERSMYTLTIITALVFCLTSIEYLPTSSEGVPTSTAFMLISLGTMTLISFMICAIISMYYGNLTGRQMPRLLRHYILEWLGPYLGCRLERKYPLWRQYLMQIKEKEKQLRESDFVRPGKCTGGEQYQDSYHSEVIDKKLREIIFQVRQREKRDNAPLQKVKVDAMLEEMVGKRGVKRLNRLLDMLLKKMEEEEEEEWTQREWKALSSALDSLFLRISSAFVFLLCIFCLFKAMTCQ